MAEKEIMELKLDRDEYIVGFSRISGGVLILTNFRLYRDRGLRVFGKKTESILIRDIVHAKFNESFLFGAHIDIQYRDHTTQHSAFFEFTDASKAKEIAHKILSLKRGEVLAPIEVPRGEVGGISLDEAEKIALTFMEQRSLNLTVDEIKHVAGTWNVILSNHDRYAVVVGDDGQVEAWKKITEN